MIRLLLALALVACERASAPPPTPTPTPPPPTCAPVADRELRLAALVGGTTGS